MSNDRDKVNETTKIKNCGGGLNASRSPPHPPSKKAAAPDHSREGLEELEKGWHCSSRVKGFPGGLKHRGSPHYDIPPTNASLYMTVLPPSLHVPK